MPLLRTAAVFGRLRELAEEQSSDRQLLEQFLARRDADAFAALVRRHGGLVFNVCRGVLAHRQDAEDAFQATFLVLARNAASIRRAESLSSWLHGVAYRIARKARGRALPYAELPPTVAASAANPAEDAAAREFTTVLHEEVDRLPARYRAPLVLCCLEGASRDEAAQRLGWTLARVKDRLERGRELLRSRLVRRGVLPATVLGAALLLPEMGPAAPPAVLANQVLRRALEGTDVPPRVAVLARGIAPSLAAASFKLATGVLVVLGLVLGGLTLAARGVNRPAPEEAEPAGSSTKETAQARKLGTDLYGDPLPPGAVARLGSLQLRHSGLSEVVFSADGKALISAGGDHVLRTWDVATGKLTRTVQFQGDLGSWTGWSLSADTRLFAAHDARTLVIWDAVTGAERKRLPVPSWADTGSYLFFSPDGHTLAGANRALDQVTVWKWKEGKSSTFAVPRTKELIRPDSTTHIGFSPDGRYLGIGPQWMEPLSIWDINEGKCVKTIEAHASTSCFTPDGKQLAVVSIDPNGTDEHVLHFYEVPGGKEVRQLPLPGKGFHWYLNFSPDGQVVAPVDTDAIYLLDRATGKELRRLGGARVGRPRMAVFSPDGRTLASIGVDRMHIWDVATGKELHEREGTTGLVYGVAYAPDGRLLATGGWVESPLSLWDPATGRRVRLLEPGWQDAYVRSLAFSPDAKTLAVGRHAGELAFVDATTGKPRRTLVLPEARKQKSEWMEFYFYHLTPRWKRAITVERTFSAGEKSQVSIWDTDPAKQVADRTLPPIPRRGWTGLGERAAFLTSEGILVADATTAEFSLLVPGAWSPPLLASPDARFLAAFSQPAQGATLHVWEAASGKLVAQLPTGPLEHLALAPDGRTLVTAGAGALRLWDLAAAKERDRIALPEDVHLAADTGVSSLCLSPDGRQATTTQDDCTLLIWSLPPRSRPEAVPLTAADAARLWSDLAAEDAAQAYAAVWKLADTPDAVAMLKKPLKPVPPVDADKARRLLRDLDNDDFEAREAATRGLEQLGRVVLPLLRQARSGNPSAETARRLDTLLGKLSGGPLSRETLQRLRAIEALRQMSSPEARGLLETLATGAPGARETEEAKAALGK